MDSATTGKVVYAAASQAEASGRADRAEAVRGSVPQSPPRARAARRDDLRPYPAAEDVVQDAFERLHRHLQRISRAVVAAWRMHAARPTAAGRRTAAWPLRGSTRPGWWPSRACAWTESGRRRPARKSLQHCGCSRTASARRSCGATTRTWTWLRSPRRSGSPRALSVPSPASRAVWLVQSRGDRARRPARGAAAPRHERDSSVSVWSRCPTAARAVGPMAGGSPRCSALVAAAAVVVSVIVGVLLAGHAERPSALWAGGWCDRRHRHRRALERRRTT